VSIGAEGGWNSWSWKTCGGGVRTGERLAQALSSAAHRMMAHDFMLVSLCCGAQDPAPHQVAESVFRDEESILG
jgi:hypothetical protein